MNAKMVERLAEVAAGAINSDRLEHSLAALSDDLGFGLYAFFHASGSRTFAISNYPKVWQELYFNRNYKSIDPVVCRAKKRTSAFCWSGLQECRYLPPAQREMYTASANFGIRSGITIPVRMPNSSLSMFTLASDCPTVQFDADFDAIAAAAAVGQLHARINDLESRPTIEGDAFMTPLESRFLRWIEVGKTVEEIATIEGVKYNTVRVCLEKAKKRFGVFNITQLTAIAIRRKLI